MERACQMWQAIIRSWLSTSIDEAGVEFCERVDRDEEQTSDAERLSLLFDDALRPPCITAVFSSSVSCDYASLLAGETLLNRQSRLMHRIDHSSSDFPEFQYPAVDFSSPNPFFLLAGLTSAQPLCSHTTAHSRCWCMLSEQLLFQLTLHPPTSLSSITTCSTTLHLSTKPIVATTSNANM